MMVSTKGRYALRVMIDLAEHNNGEFIPLSDVAKRQEISEKYLEGIISVFSKNGFLEALRGKGGGYRISRSPETYTVGSILKLIEGSLAPISCLEKKPNSCKRASECRTIGMWTKLDKMIDDFFEGITLDELIHDDHGSDNYSI